MSINSVGVSSSIYTQANAGIEKASERIASGSRINSAADDASGLAISNRLSSQISEFSQGIRNANDGVSYLQTAEAGLSSITDNLQRLRELSLQAANGTLNPTDRQFLDKEAQQIKAEVTRIVEESRFNGKELFTNTDKIAIQVGSGDSDSIDVGTDNFQDILGSLQFDTIDLNSADGANAALSIVDQLQAGVDNSSANIGAQINRLDSSVNSLYNSQEKAVESRSRIQDADLAKEISELTANTLKQDIAIALQVKSNNNADNVLRLLGGG